LQREHQSISAKMIAGKAEFYDRKVASQWGDLLS
jgi:hypothetical protein